MIEAVPMDHQEEEVQKADEVRGNLVKITPGVRKDQLTRATQHIEFEELVDVDSTSASGKSAHAKLASALLTVAKGQAQFALQLFCEECHMSGRLPTGRQLLQIFIKEFSIDSEQATLHDLHDVLALLNSS
eukprot:5099289-Amphidinium_carterae.2